MRLFYPRVSNQASLSDISAIRHISRILAFFIRYIIRYTIRYVFFPRM
jgi:hypothetical protein